MEIEIVCSVCGHLKYVLRTPKAAYRICVFCTQHFCCDLTVVRIQWLYCEFIHFLKTESGLGLQMKSCG